MCEMRSSPISEEKLIEVVEKSLDACTEGQASWPLCIHYKLSVLDRACSLWPTKRKQNVSWKKCFGYKQDNQYQYLHTLYLNRLCTKTFVGIPNMFDHSPAPLFEQLETFRAQNQNQNQSPPFQKALGLLLILKMVPSLLCQTCSLYGG